MKILPGQRFRLAFAERVDRQRRRNCFCEKTTRLLMMAYAERSNREARSRSVEVEGTDALDWLGTTALRLARG